MKNTLVLLLLLVFVPAFAEEAPSHGFNFSTGIEIGRSTGPQNETGKRSIKFIENQKSMLVVVSDFFYTAEPFEIPWLNNLSSDKGTLTISTKQKTRWFGTATREEFFRSISVRIDGKRLKKGQIIYVYNNDTGEVLGHYQVQMNH
jgi:hypothetical protein